MVVPTGMPEFADADAGREERSRAHPHPRGSAGALSPCWRGWIDPASRSFGRLPRVFAGCRCHSAVAQADVDTYQCSNFRLGADAVRRNRPGSADSRARCDGGRGESGRRARPAGRGTAGVGAGGAGAAASPTGSPGSRRGRAGGACPPRRWTPALARARLLDEVVALDRRQPEFTQTFWQYLDKRITPQRIERARRLLAEHSDLLEATTAGSAYNRASSSPSGRWRATSAISPGRIRRSRRSRRWPSTSAAPPSSASSSWPCCRASTTATSPSAATGSWAGALGQPQFIPTTYRRFAVDGDGDGRRDLWGSLPTSSPPPPTTSPPRAGTASGPGAARFALPPGFDLTLSGLETQKPLAEWQRLGVRDADGQILPVVDLSGLAGLPGGIAGGPALLVYPNFRAS